MNETISALLGAAVGFAMPTIKSYLEQRTKGAKYEQAVEVEIQAAEDAIINKMKWLSRDERNFVHGKVDKHFVEYEGKLLYLGEDEQFEIEVPFWENNIREIVEVLRAVSFRRLSGRVLLIKKFVMKFRDMKLAFKTGHGDAKKMGLACYKDLLNIYSQLHLP